MSKKYRFDGKRKAELKKISRDETSQCSEKEEALQRLKSNLIEINELQNKLFAEKRQGVIVLFQAMDAAGKDGTIRSLLQGLSTQGVKEVSFKALSAQEKAHDYLWRVHQNVPAKGEIVIFNRSHYEEVLIHKVMKLNELEPQADWVDKKKMIELRYEHIKGFEEYLYQNSIKTIKFFLNVSKAEQAERFLERIEEPEKNWNFTASDYLERQYWNEYQKAFEEAINKTASKHCPWYIIPADHKWYMHYLVSEIIFEELKAMKPAYPLVSNERQQQLEQYRIKLIEDLENS